MGLLCPFPFPIGVLLRQVAPLNSVRFYAPLLKDVCPKTLEGIVPPCYLNFIPYAPYFLEALTPPYILEYLLGGVVAYYWNYCAPPPSPLSLLEDLCSFNR